MTRLKLSALAMVGILGTSFASAQWCDCCSECDGECSSCFSAYLDIYFLKNWNHPLFGENGEGRTYDIFSQNPSIAEISARWHRSAGGGVPFGINIDLYGGRNSDLDHFYDPAGSKYRAIKEGFISFGGGSWGVDVGKFNTWVSKESRTADHNTNYSRGLQYHYLKPVFGTGARAWFDFGSNMQLGVAGVLGWNESEDSNDDMSFGGWLRYKGEMFNAKASMYTGTEGSDDGNFGGFYGFNDPVDVNVFAFNFDFDLGERANLGFEATMMKVENFTDGTTGEANFNGYAGYFTYDWSETTTLGARFEQFEDEDGFFFNTGEKITSYTINVAWKTGDIGKVRFEYRNDSADSTLFSGSGGNEDSRTTWSVSYQVRVK